MKLSLKKKNEQLPTKAEKALAIAEVIVESNQAMAKTFKDFGVSMASIGITTAQAAAAAVQLAQIGATPSQPEEHPLAKAVREAVKKQEGK